VNALVVIIWTALAAADPAEISVETVLDPPVIPYHKQARFAVTVEAPEDAQVRLPDMVPRFGGLAVYGTPEYRSRILKNNRVRITETYTLDAIFPGDYLIEPVTVTWGDGQSVTVPSPALRVRELTEEEIADAEQFDAALPDPDFTPAPFYTRWPFWAALGGLAVAALAMLLFLRRRKTEQAAEASKTPWEVAYERLRVLDQQGYPRLGRYEPYYVDLSSILRYYIEDRFHVHAPERTTPEFLEEIDGSGVLTDEQERMLARFLRHCDLVKFAQYKPTVEEMERSFTQVLQFVDETVPKPVEGPREKAA
jgi:hypothetical protein